MISFMGIQKAGLNDTIGEEAGYEGRYGQGYNEGYSDSELKINKKIWSGIRRPVFVQRRMETSHENSKST